MLINEVVEFCDEQYSSFGNMCGQKDGICTHPSGHCSGSCYDCLYEIHYPGRATDDSKKLYDCPKMLYQYVCQYSYLYTTELLCAFASEWDFIKDFPYYHILSLGCGGCADLMAIENLLSRKNISRSVSYIGIDINQLWQPIHEKIKECCQCNGVHFKARYYDVFDCFKERGIADTNIIVLSYLISYLYNTEQIATIDSLIHDITKNIVVKKKPEQHLLLIINDVNSNRRGRDCFSRFERAIKKSGLNILQSKYRYFDTGKLNDFQKIGQPYNVRNCVFEIPTIIQMKYHAQSSINSTIQLILEVM